MSIVCQRLIRDGVAARTRGDIPAAERAFRAALKADPRRADVRRELAMALSLMGEADSALAEMRRALAARPHEAAWHHDLGELLIRAGQTVYAIECFEKAAELNPKEAMYPGRLAALQWRLRQRDVAVEWAQRALAIDPKQEMARLTMVRVHLAEKDLGGAEEILKDLVEDSRLKSTRCEALHLLGTIREKQQRWGEAFDSHDAGNALMLPTHAVQQALRLPIDAWLPHYTAPGAAEKYAAWGRRTFDDGLPAPIVLTGFPRSGTTLVEQVLSAHPRLTTGDELPVNIKVVRRVAQMLDAMPSGTMLDRMDALTDAQILELRGMWWAALRGGIDPEEADRVIIDKHPLRVLSIGLINRLFPGAKIVVMIRDPRDVCISAMFQHFVVNPGMVRFLEQRLCGQWYATVMGFWLTMRDMITVPWMELRYEDLVDDFHPHVRRMLEFIGQPWDDAVERFHEHAAQRVVLSASSEQVTQKLHTRSVGKWKHFEDRIGPMTEILRPFVERLGYDDGAASA